MSWPKQVPVLEAKDIHKGDLSSKCGKKHCLVGWSREVFPFQNRVKAIRQIRLVCRERFKEFSIPHVNDHRATKKQAAEIWNEAMRQLGYTEVEELET